MKKRRIGCILILIGLLILIVTVLKHLDYSAYINYMLQKYSSIGLEESIINYDVSYMVRTKFIFTILGFLEGLGFILIGYYLTKKK